MGPKSRKTRAETEPERFEGSTSRIRTVVERVNSRSDALRRVGQIQAVHEGMKQKRKAGKFIR